MDFLEKLLGIAPDGGSGALEISVVMVVAVLVFWLAVPGFTTLRRLMKNYNATQDTRTCAPTRGTRTC